MSPSANDLTLQAGGAVNLRTSVYIVRRTDDELLQLLTRGEYCNVLCSRQMGKTSLLKRTRARLAEQGYATAEIDVAGYLGSPQDVSEWYQGLLQGIARQLNLQVDVRAWWQTCEAITPNQRLIQFFHDEIAAKAQAPVMIFLDEIDSTLKLPYTDDFFVAIRTMYNDRAAEPIYQKIVFCLVGVATPNELIKDRRPTPYNIGKTLELPDFDLEHDDLTPLYSAISPEIAIGRAVVQHVVNWTGGHPFLTLRLCEEYTTRHGGLPDAVDQIAQKTFTNLASLRSDVHFEQMLRFFSERVDDKLTVLTLYRRVLAGKRVPDQATPAHVQLKLMGVVKCNQQGLLVVRNQIYRRVYTNAWARDTMPTVERRVRMLQRLAIAAVIPLVLSPVLWYELIYPRAPIETLSLVMDDYQLAQAEYQKLKHVPFYSSKANTLLARFYERYALHIEQSQLRDKALLWRLKALASQPTDDRARAVNDLIGLDYTQLALTFRHHRGVTVVAFSPDRKIVLTGSADNTARLWQVETGQPFGPPLQHQDVIRAVAFSPDGKIVLTGSDDNTARLWQAETGQPFGPPLQHQDVIRAVAFSPDGKTILTGSDDNTVRLWQAETGQPLGPPLQYQDTIMTVSFSPDVSTAVLATSWWIHVVQFNATNTQPLASHLLPSLWIGGTFSFLNASASQIRVAMSATGNAIHIITLHLDRPNADPVQGKPADLLEDWGKRLGLQINVAGEIIPLYSDKR
jgi:AAA-like domain/WD domain, G-beta repeat